MTVSRTCIQYWNRKWYPACNTSTVWPNHRQGVVYMLSGGMKGRFFEPSQSKKANWKWKTLSWHRKVQVSFFSFSRLFLARRSNCHPFCPSLAIGTKNTGCAWDQILLLDWFYDLMFVYLTNTGFWLHWYEGKDMWVLGGKNHFLTPVNNWIHDCIRDWNPGLDPEVGSSLECEYSVIRGAAKAACYSPYVRRSLGGASTRSMGGKVRWVVGWVCGNMVY